MTPSGIPASVKLSGKSTYVAAKPEAGSTATIVLTVDPGAYKVVADGMTVDGRFYVPDLSRPEVPATAGRTADLRVTYTLDDSAKDFRASAIHQTSLTLTWTADPRYRITVRRTPGPAPAKAPDQGVDVPVSGDSATDTGLKSGTEYTYGLFAQYRGKWSGPMVLRVGTASADPKHATYVAGPQTQLLDADDIVAAVPTGSGVRLTLAPGLATPLIGAGVTLPISSSLPGGYLGVVAGVQADGRTLDLVAGGISDAFDYYELSVPNIQGGDPQPAATLKASPSPSSGPVSPSKRKPLPTAASKPAAKAAGGAAGGAGAELSCSASAEAGVTFTPAVSIGGHFHGVITKYSFLGKNIPTGATLDMAVTATVSGTVAVKTSAAASCTLEVEPKMVTLATQPVPFSIYLEPKAKLTLSGKASVSNVGLTATGGVQVAGHLSVKDGASFTASPILSAAPTTPVIEANVGLNLKLGGKLIVGAGAGTSKAGVIAGLGGDFYPLDATFTPVFPADDPRYNVCLKAAAAFSRSLNLTAKAFLGSFDISATIPLKALDGESPYPGSPWYLPSGCEKASTPGDTVLGDGVTKVEDAVSGGQNQWGYLSGLVPGKKTWVLSTGDIGDVVGVPSKFASTQLGGPGDDDLTELSGHPTYDAVSYTVTLVPDGSTLHVKYLFASEEYPEYVGSQYNDVMAVLVGGKNCALLPGTATPVSVNSINMNVNSQYYIDNTGGAAGLSTSMDGLTIPLECKVPVKAGQPVTVKITVADSSDRIYDSAVALLDQGIWAS
ncbi:choice-of-anchor L domain-containing protein [Nonomuraea sp. NPDC050556]|uniref:choice-of-anchor L domain-containing protein n=1 Tax=Nonomuraea sp. NPDC050556 TaxID=3364369 RepID=UPI0037B13BEC